MQPSQWDVGSPRAAARSALWGRLVAQPGCNTFWTWWKQLDAEESSGYRTKSLATREARLPSYGHISGCIKRLVTKVTERNSGVSSHTPWGGSVLRDPNGETLTNGRVVRTPGHLDTVSPEQWLKELGQFQMDTRRPGRFLFEYLRGCHVEMGSHELCILQRAGLGGDGGWAYWTIHCH